MNRLSIDIGFKATQLDYENLKNGLAYISSDIKTIELDPSALLIHLGLLEAASPDEIEKEVKKLLLKYQPIAKENETKVIYESVCREVANKKDVFPELIKRGDLIKFKNGYFGMSGKLLKYFRKVDQAILKFAESFEASDIVFPITTEIDTLNKHDFFKQTPQFANFISTINEDQSNISECSKKMSSNNSNIKEHLHNPTSMCRSAICLNSYPCFENKIFADNHSMVWTSVGKVFRNESTNVQTLERLHEFTMRELIFYGTYDFIESALHKTIEWHKELIEKLDLYAIIQSANDPFFADNFSSLRFYQMSQLSKYEVHLPNSISGNNVSCASMNNHATHFSKSYNIKFENGEHMFTGCSAWGLERYIFMILQQHGLDEGKWPKNVTDFLKD